MNLFGVDIDWKTALAVIGGIGGSIGLALTYYFAYRRGRISVLKEQAEQNIEARKKADKDYDDLQNMPDDELIKLAKSKLVRGGK